MAYSCFFPTTDGFSLHNALWLARASELAYRPGAAIEATIVRQWGFDHFAFVDADETQGFVASDSQTVLISFRGTETDRVADWLTDADSSLVDGPLQAKVHGGFYDALSHAWQAVDQLVRRWDADGQKLLWITGHSLGAALATLSAARWIEHGRAVQGLYTFGQPRTGDRKFAREFNFRMKCNTFRIVNNDDLVTRLPPRAVGFSHLGTFKYFTENGQLSHDTNWWRHFLSRWTFQLDELLAAACGTGIADHSMVRYRELVEAALGKATRSGTRASKVEEFCPAPEQSALVEPRRRAA